MKRLKREISLCSLPDQVLDLVFEYSGTAALVNLSSMNKYYREQLLAMIFKRIKVTWFELQALEFQQFLVRNKAIVRQIRVIDSFSYGEWQVDIFKGILQEIPHLAKFAVNSFNSSNWLKYREHENITCLKMYYDFKHNETEECHANPNPKNIQRLNKPSKIPKIFDLHHLKGFRNLVQLHLSDYHFNWDEKMDLISLKLITLVDCTWEYPFTPLKFNENNSVIEFKLQYSDDNSFILLERFVKFLSDPFQNNCHIQRMGITLTSTEHGRVHYLSFSKLNSFLNEQKFPNLKDLDFTGWEIEEKSLFNYLTQIGTVNINTLTVDLHNQTNNPHHQFPHLNVKSRRKK